MFYNLLLTCFYRVGFFNKTQPFSFVDYFRYKNRLNSCSHIFVVQIDDVNVCVCAPLRMKLEPRYQERILKLDTTKKPIKYQGFSIDGAFLIRNFDWPKTGHSFL